MCLHVPLFFRVSILPQWQTKRQPHLTSILSHQVAKKERNMHNRNHNTTSPSQSVSKEIVKDSKTYLQELIANNTKFTQASSQIPHTIAPVHTDSYSKTGHIVLLKAPDNSIQVQFVLDKTFLIPSR
jgi:hypothetical protein